MSDVMNSLHGGAIEAPAPRRAPTTTITITIPMSQETLFALSCAVLAAGAFCLYWGTSLILEARSGASSFGADSNLYTKLAFGVLEDRIARFHPAIVGLSIAWMKIVSPLTPWIAPQHLLFGLYAAIGAAGVWAATAAFDVLVPRRYVLFCGLIYATSMGAWYFASIAESKILTATLATAYIAVYLRLRENWRWQGSLWLTALLGLSCLNEIVSAFLVAIPATDMLLRGRLDWKAARWLVAHCLVVVAAYFIIEVTVSGLLTPPAADNMESGSSSKMFWFYFGISDHSPAALYGYLLNWFLFTIGAPSAHAYAATPIWPTYFGYFETSFMPYFSHAASAGVVVLGALMLLVQFVPAWRTEGDRLPPVAPLLAYTVLRGAFFFAFNPAEVMLFSTPVVLPLLIMLVGPFAASRFPARTVVLVAFCALLLADNLRFMIG